MWGYTYNAREQLVRRNLDVGGTNLTHFVHDLAGNVIAETNGTAAGTVREYIWLPETEIAPTYQSRAQVDRPVAVVDGLGGPLFMVHVDHLNRPLKMTNSAKASVWDAVWLPWGGTHSITGTATMNARFPGQWFQLEAGLHYNWHRSYDPTIGRYTQPDPLGFVDGPGVYGYAKGSPGQLVDPDGRQSKSGPFSRPRPPFSPPSPTIPWPDQTPAPWWWSPQDAIKACWNFIAAMVSRPTAEEQEAKRCEKVHQACHQQCWRYAQNHPTPGIGGADRPAHYVKCMRRCKWIAGCGRVEEGDPGPEEIFPSR